MSGTNINAALLSAAQLVNPSSSGSVSHLRSHRVPLVIFLTDGEATTGVTSSDAILTNAKKALSSVSLFGLAFGDDADFLLLKRLALENRGVARMVYEDADAALQLKGFYDEVASPLLSDIQLSYLDDQAFDVTRSLFPNYFQGSELVVAGRVKPGVTDFKVSVSATDSKQSMMLENNVLISNVKENESADVCLGNLERISSFVHRLWAYFTIKELLMTKMNATDPAAQRLLAEKATNLSLKYNFVTPVTSLVVVKPDADETAETSTTAKPTTTATTPTTTTSTDNSRISTADVAKKPNSSSNLRLNKSKADSSQQAPNILKPKKKSLPAAVTEKVSPSKKTTAALSPSPIKTDQAPFSGRKPTIPQNESKTVSPPPAQNMSTVLLNHLQTAQPTTPGKLYPPVLRPMKTFSVTTHMPTFTATLSSPTSSPKGNSAPLTGGTATSPVRVTELSSDAETSTKSALDLQKPETTTGQTKLLPTLSSLTLAAAPTMQDKKKHSKAETEDHIATLVSATFAPMPDVTDEPQLWEAAGLLGRLHGLMSEVH